MEDRVFKYWHSIEHRIQKRFKDQNITDQALIFVFNRLQENNWGRLKAFNYQSKFSTFLFAVANRLIEDFARQKFGRRRPPVWITSLGGIWVTVYKLLCLERFSVPDVVETMSTSKEYSSKRNVEYMATTILGRVTDCGRYDENVVADQNVENCANPADGETVLAEEEKKQLFSYIFDVLIHGKSNQRHLSRRPSLLKEISFSENLKIEPEERLLLRLVYQDGIRVSTASRMLGLTPHQGHSKLRRLKKRLYTHFQKNKLLDEIKLMLSN